MAKRLTVGELAELERLAKAATPGPWRHEANDKPFMFKDAVYAPCECCGHIAGEVAGCDADFIAASRSAVPRLVADLRAAGEDLDNAESRYRCKSLDADWFEAQLIERTAQLRAREAQVEAVKALHQPGPIFRHDVFECTCGFSEHWMAQCIGCEWKWSDCGPTGDYRDRPCPTAAALGVEGNE